MAADAADELLHAGRAALAAGDWAQARACFEQAAQLDDSAEALDGLGQALHFEGEYARAIECKERRSRRPRAHRKTRSRRGSRTDVVLGGRGDPPEHVAGRRPHAEQRELRS